jgi:prepilin-type N-terminal cleavage/methylation domain-containing protein
MININFLNKNRGFTMIETLVAVAILMISVAGPLTIAQKGLNAAIYARDQVVASFLAQDAMEFIKNYRDNNIIVGTGWLAGLYGDPLTFNVCNLSTPTKFCTVDTTGASPSITYNTYTTASQTLYNDGAGYKTSGTKTSKFSRRFYITNVSSDEATAVVEVIWYNGTIQNSVILEDQIFRIIR